MIAVANRRRTDRRDSGNGARNGARGGDAPRRTVVGRLVEHPVISVVVVGVAAAAWHLWWVGHHRHVGGFGVDESGYLASALHLHGAWLDDGPAGLARAVMRTPRNAPLIPLMSVPFLGLFGRTTTAAFVPLGVLYVVTAGAIAGIATRLSGRVAGLVAGLVALGLPTAVITARLYQLGSGVNAFLALAVLFVLRSDRGRRTADVVGVGVAVGLMLMARTMPLAFVPGVVVAAWLAWERSRRVLRNAVAGVLAALAVAGPWWIAQWDGIVRYLFSFGYGSGTEEIPSLPLLLRVPVRLGLLTLDVRLALLLPAALVLVAVFVDARRWRRSTGSVRGWRGGVRELAAVWAVIGVGALALLSSSNNGTFFQSPLEVLAVAAVVGTGARLLVGPGPALSDRARGLVRGSAVAAVAAAVVGVSLISVWRPGADVDLGDSSLSVNLLGGTEDLLAMDFAPDEPRFEPSASWDDRRAAERDWAAAARRIRARARELAGGDPQITVVGELTIMNANTLLLSAELAGEEPRVESPGTPEAMLDGEIGLDPVVSGRRRVLVSVVPEDPERIQGHDPTGTLERATAEGWRIADRIPLPAGGVAVLRTHPAGR